MKQSQLDIFGSEPAGERNEIFETPEAAKTVRARKPREAKKAPMIVDSYVPATEAGSKKPFDKLRAQPEARSPEPEVRRQETEGRIQQTKEPRIYSVSEITGDIKSLLERSYTDIWISGEITDFRNRTGRHLYFALKDEASKIRAVIFNAEGRKIPFELKDGLEVICHGSIDVYAPQGSYSIIIDYIEPKGIGALQLAFEQLKKKLEAEGLFERARKKPIPYLPKKIGVVTSPTGAAIRDIVHVLTRRFPNIEILLSPVRVQGEGAAKEIAAAIGGMNQRCDIDVMIVGRGGGSIEDLWAFNEEVVARAIFSSRIPIISAVGHEIDFTIADFVADSRAATPSAAAEIAVPVKDELKAMLADRQRALGQALKQSIINKWNRVRELKGRIKDPRQRFPDLMLRIDGLRQRLIYSVNVGIDRRGQLISKYASNLDHLSPLGVLAKGYSVVQRRKDRESIRSVKQINVGDELRILFHEGSAGARVTDISEK